MRIRCLAAARGRAWFAATPAPVQTAATIRFIPRYPLARASPASLTSILRSSVPPVTRSGKSSRKRGRAGLHVHAVRIAAGAAPVGGFRAQQPCRIETERIAMVGVHVLDSPLLGLQQPAGVGNIGQKLLRLEVHDPAKTRHQMRSRGPDSKKRKILKLYKGFCRRMGTEIAPAPCLQLIGPGLFGAARQHDPGTLQRVALGPLVQHQRDPVVGKNIPGVQRHPGNQQDRRAIEMAGHVHQRAIGIAASGRQSRQSALPAAPEQRPGQSACIKIRGGLHRSSPDISLLTGSFPG